MGQRESLVNPVKAVRLPSSLALQLWQPFQVISFAGSLAAAHPLLVSTNDG